MRTMQRRLRSLEARLGPCEARLPVNPASVRWSNILGVLLNHLPKDDPGIADVLDRMRRSIAFLEDYAAHKLPKHPERCIERFCEEYMTRLREATGNWQRHYLAFFDADYEDRLRELGMGASQLSEPAVGDAATWYVPGRIALP